MRGDFVDDQLERWSHVAFDQVPAACCPIAGSEHDMGMDGGLSVLLCDVTADRKQFDLLCDPDLAELVRLPVKPGDGGSGEAADPGETRGGDLPLIAPTLQLLDDLVAHLKHQHELSAVLGPGDLA